MKYTTTKFLEKNSKKPSGSKDSWKDPRVYNWINNRKIDKNWISKLK